MNEKSSDARRSTAGAPDARLQSGKLSLPAGAVAGLRGVMGYVVTLVAFACLGCHAAMVAFSSSLSGGTFNGDRTVFSEILARAVFEIPQIFGNREDGIFAAAFSLAMNGEFGSALSRIES